MSNLRIILGDQLSESISSLQGIKKDDHVLMMEVQDEAEYVWHHPKKLAFIFSAMRHFAEELRSKGLHVIYIKLDAPESQASFTQTLLPVIERIKPKKILITEPGEYRVLEMIKSWEKLSGTPVEILPDQRFFVSIDYFKSWAKNKKSLRMEFFYRELRKLSGFLMEKDQPVGGQWNFDSENRHPLKEKIKLPKPFSVKPDSITQEVLALVKKRFPKNFGSLENFEFAVTRQEALHALKHFIKHALAHFGEYQDAMLSGENAIFHSQLSQYLNIGLLLPKEVCQAAEKAYVSGSAPLNSVEGFIRQILGWREFVRGIYWLKMPKYRDLNYFNAKEPLPNFYWHGQTKMNCLSQVIKMTERDAMSHHIQRLMITGNFALLLGVTPIEVCDWYLAVYADAYEWVELPNTLGMAIFADGGFLASKPYAASGAYINRMSNFCQNCHFNVKEKLGSTACPFNYLYWDFMLRHKAKLSSNPRLKFAYANLAKMPDPQKTAIQQQAAAFRAKLKESKEAE